MKYCTLVDDYNYRFTLVHFQVTEIGMLRTKLTMGSWLYSRYYELSLVSLTASVLIPVAQFDFILSKYRMRLY